MTRAAILTGSPGAVADAVERALAGAGYEPRRAHIAPDGQLRLDLGPQAADVVVHLGLRTPRDLPEKVRADAEAAAATAAADLAWATGARRLIHVSTVAVYGTPRNLPCREGELKRPRSTYERIRWRAEQASWAAFRKGAPLSVLRPAILYGPGLRGGPLRAVALVSLFNQGKRRVPIIRRGPVAHLLHVEDLARAVVHVARHEDDGDVVGRAFNVGDEAPLALAEHLETALAALGFETGRVLPAVPRLTAALLWLFRHVPDAALLGFVNRRLGRSWRRFTRGTGTDFVLAPRVDREALHWMAADHYYDVSRLVSIGWRATHPVSTHEVARTIRSLVAEGLLPDARAKRALPAG